MDVNFTNSLRSMEGSSIKTVAVIGAGCMGRGIVEVALISKKKIILFNRSENRLSEAVSYISTRLEDKVKRGKLSLIEREQCLNSLIPTCQLDDIQDSDLIIETISEDFEIKRGIYEKIGKIVKETTIIAT